MSNRLFRIVPAVVVAAPFALGFYAHPSAQAQAPAQPPQQQGQTTTAAAPPAAPDQQNGTPPTFRAGINFVRVDVLVSDKQGNPVNDLRQQDFEVTEDGKPQTIQTFKLINVQQRDSSTPVAPLRDIHNAIDEQTEASRDDSRVFAIFLDDYHVRKENSLRVREPVAQFVESQLAPSDLIATMYPLTPLDEVLLTRNHANVASAVRSFLGRKYDYTARNILEERYVNYVSTIEAERIRNDVSLSALKALIVHLGGLREGRKAILLVSEGYTNTMPAQAQDAIAAQPSGGPRAPDPLVQSTREQSTQYFQQAEMLGDIKRLYEMANRYNTTIYAIDPRGLANFEYDLSRSNVSLEADKGVLENTLDTLRLMAAETGGRAIVNSNDLDKGLRQIVKDATAYYLLGYTTTQNATDGKFHQIQVKVKRSGLDVRARKGYLAFTPEEVERAVAPPKAGPPKAVADALGTLAVSRRSLIRTWIGMSPGANGKTKVSFVWEPMPALPGGGARTEVPARVSIIAGSPKSDLYFRGKVPDPAAAGQPARVEFEVPPGEVDLDIAIDGATGENIDRDTQKLMVPSLGVGLTLATPAVFRARTVREFQTLAADPNPIPTPEREFRRTDRLLLRVAGQSPTGTPPVVTARLLNREGGAMNALTTAPGSVPGVTNVDVPLANLPPGEFLIELTAADGNDKTTALVAIRVTS